MFSTKQNDCVGFDSIWKVKRVYTASSAQTTEFSSQENATNTAQSRSIETQTDRGSVSRIVDADMNKLSDWLHKVYPRVSRELNESISSNAFKNYKVVSSEQPVTKLIQTVKVQENNGDNIYRVSTLSWNCTGNTLAVACDQFHKTWCYHPGAVFLYTFDRYDKMPEIPSKRLPTETCVSVVRFHPRIPSIIASGTQSGMLYHHRKHIHSADKSNRKATLEEIDNGNRFQMEKVHMLDYTLAEEKLQQFL